MGLETVIEETRKALEEAKAKEGALAEQVEEEKPAEPAPDAEPVKEEPKPETEPPAKVEEKPAEPVAEKTAADYARERREARSQVARMAEQLAAAEAKIAALEATAKPKPAADAVPSKDDDPVAYFEWKANQLEKQMNAIAEETAAEKKARIERETEARAFGELAQYEAQIKQSKPDYDNAKQFYVSALAYGFRVQDPNISEIELRNKVNRRVLERAAVALRNGFENPVEGLYEEAKRYGYQESALAQVKDEPKPDLAKLANHRARNSGMAGAAGRGAEGDLTPVGAAGMTAGEWAKLSPDQKRAVFAQLRTAS